MPTTRALNVAAAISALALAVAAVLAVVNLRAISEPAFVDISIPASAVETATGIVHGTIHDGLPPFSLHWDGQPPSAVLVDATSGVVLAAAAFSDRTFEANRSAVRFVSGEVRFKLDARRWSAGTPLAIRSEAVKPRGGFVFWASAAALAAIALLVFVVLRERGLQLAGSLVFIVIACGIFVSLYPGAPIRIDEVTDEAAINSYAAAKDHPDRFALDKLLSDSSNYRWYTPAYIDTVRVFKRLGFHYQTAFAFLGAASALLFLFGARRLFADISGRADVGLAAALALGLMFDANVPPPGEYWSMLSGLPRTVFTAFVPWVLLLALAGASSSRRWWMACAAAGLLLNIHPLSAPVLVGALLTAFVAGSDEPVPARLTGAAIALGAVLLAMSPYAVIYGRHYAAPGGLDGAAAARATEIVRATFGWLRPGAVARDLLVHRAATVRVVLDVLAIGLLIRAPFDRCTRFYLGLVTGFFLVTFGIPIADSAVSAYLDRRQFEYELVRNVRYLDLLLVGALAIGVRGWRGSRTYALAAASVAVLATAIALSPGWLQTGRLIGGWSRLTWRIVTGHPDAESGAAQEAIRAVQALRAAGERVSGPLGLRQFDVPLAWIARDIASQSYAVSPGLIESADVVPRAAPLLARPLTEESLAQLSSILEAPLFLVRVRQLDPSLLGSIRILFKNDVYAVVRGAPGPRPAAGGRVGDRSTARGIVGVASPIA